MDLRQAIQGLIVVVAVFFATAAGACDHASLAGRSPVKASVPAVSTPAALIAATQIGTPNSETDSEVRAAPDAPVRDGCPPGACHCQGASTCGASGHCCASILPEAVIWLIMPNTSRLRQLARFAGVYPDIAFGLDRPPKL